MILWHYMAFLKTLNQLNYDVLKKVYIIFLDFFFNFSDSKQNLDQPL